MNFKVKIYVYDLKDLNEIEVINEALRAYKRTMPNPKERELADNLNLERVNVRPVKKAGGSFATRCYENFENPAAVEHIKADFGIDIGDTLIGMHLKHVAVPVRTKVRKIGEAHVTAAKTRLKYIGGERGQYEG